MKRILFITAIALILNSCQKQGNNPAGTEIQTTFFTNISFGDDKETVLNGFYAQGFTDAASKEKDAHFDSIPTGDGNNFIQLKILMPPHPEGFDFQGLKWNNVQVQLDSKGLFSMTFHSPSAGKEKIERQCRQLLRTLQKKGYGMARTVIGQSSIEGQATHIVGYRYSDGKRIVQFYRNDTGDSLSSISLSYTEN